MKVEASRSRSSRRDSKSIRNVEIPKMAAIAALEQGRVDGITITNPAYSIAMASGKARLVATIFGAISPRFLLVTWFSTTAWVERNRAAAEVQPVIDVAVKYKVIEKGYAASELLSDVLAK